MHRKKGRTITALLIALTLCVTSAQATHYVVDINGGGDFTTIQAALDAWQTTGWRDSILVMPGVYMEHIEPHTWTTLIGVEGAGVTKVQSATIDDFYSRVFEGLSFLEAVTFGGGFYNAAVLMVGCSFLSGAVGWAPSLVDCDFYARTVLRTEHPSTAVLSSLKFHRAPFYLSYYNGDLTVSDCSFDGPADTLVYIPAVTQGDPVTIRNCRFKGAKNGLVLGERYDGRYEIARCQFSDISEAAIWRNNSDPSDAESRVRASVNDSRFERCGAAVRWRDRSGWGASYSFHGGGTLSLMADTILACGGDALAIGPITSASVSACIVEGGAGRGLVFHQQRPDGDFWSDYEWTASVSNSIFANNRGPGVVFEDSTGSQVASGQQPKNIVQSCTFANNGGAGIEVACGEWSVDGCASLGNDGDGFSLSKATRGSAASLSSNTSVLNGRNGFRVAEIAPSGDSLVLARNNLAVMNAQDGFRMPHASVGSFAFNDAWGNYLAQYAGAWGSLDSNLVVDPRFCDLSAGANGLGLQQGSPCGPSGVYGLIGARPEECPNTAAVGPDTPPVLAFAVRPSIARAATDFVPPSTGAEGLVELFDVAGRIVWRAPLGPATGVVRWRGGGEGGRVRAGLYWARFTRGGERATQRLVWLE